MIYLVNSQLLPVSIIIKNKGGSQIIFFNYLSNLKKTKNGFEPV